MDIDCLTWQKEDPSVGIVEVQLPNGARFTVAVNVTALGGSMWRYDYAVFNLNSDRSVGSFSVPIFKNANVINTVFHDVDYHSGEIFDGTDWAVDMAGNQITWSSETFDINANANYKQETHARRQFRPARAARITAGNGQRWLQEPLR